MTNKLPPRLRCFTNSGIAIALLLGLSSTSWAQNDNELAYRVEAAFIYNFTKFTRWPEDKPTSPDSAFNVCVAGNKKFHAIVDQTLSNKAAWGRTLTSEYINSPRDASECQVVFLGFSERREIDHWIASAAKEQILTISNNKNFVEAGGIIQLVIVGGKVRFDINQSALEKSQLVMSSKLLSLARNIRQ